MGGGGIGLVIEFFDKLTKNPNLIFFLIWGGGEAGGGGESGSAASRKRSI